MTDRVIALGFFDGVHLGHGALLRETAGIAAREKLEPAALTFLGHVAGKPARQLTTPEERERSIRELYGLKTVFLTFDEQLRGTMLTWWPDMTLPSAEAGPEMPRRCRTAARGWDLAAR